MEERGVCPVIVDGASETLFLFAFKQAAIVGAKAPAETRVQLCPAVGDLAVVNHLLHVLEREFRGGWE